MDQLREWIKGGTLTQMRPEGVAKHDKPSPPTWHLMMMNHYYKVQSKENELGPKYNKVLDLPVSSTHHCLHISATVSPNKGHRFIKVFMLLPQPRPYQLAYCIIRAKVLASQMPIRWARDKEIARREVQTVGGAGEGVGLLQNFPAIFI